MDEWIMDPEQFVKALAGLSEEETKKMVSSQNALIKQAQQREAILLYLLSCCTYHYGSGQPPSPVEYGLEWSWQQNSPNIPDLYEMLYADALKYFSQIASEIDPEEDISSFELMAVRYMETLRGPALDIIPSV